MESIALTGKRTTLIIKESEEDFVFNLLGALKQKGFVDFDVDGGQDPWPLFGQITAKELNPLIEEAEASDDLSMEGFKAAYPVLENQPDSCNGIEEVPFSLERMKILQALFRENPAKYLKEIQDYQRATYRERLERFNELAARIQPRDDWDEWYREWDESRKDRSYPFRES